VTRVAQAQRKLEAAEKRGDALEARLIYGSGVCCKGFVVYFTRGLGFCFKGFVLRDLWFILPGV